jgi:hypothetical protein
VRIKDLFAMLVSYAVIWTLGSFYVMQLERRVTTLENERIFDEALEGLEWV